MSEAFDVRIITASYRREPVEGPEEPQVPVIQLFGRTREGKSIAVEYSGFKPYFFVVAPPQALRGAFARDKQVVSFEDVSLEVEGRPTPCARVTLRQPWKTPEYREKARKFGSTPLEADIPFQHRFIYDMDLSAADRTSSRATTSTDTTCRSSSTGPRSTACNGSSARGTTPRSSTWGSGSGGSTAAS